MIDPHNTDILFSIITEVAARNGKVILSSTLRPGDMEGLNERNLMLLNCFLAEQVWAGFYGLAMRLLWHTVLPHDSWNQGGCYMEKIWLSFFSIDNDNAVFYAEVPKGLFSEGMVLALGRDHALMLYGEDKWDSFLERIKTLPPENAKMLRPFLTFSAPCYNCGDTAVRVSKTMLDYAGIKSKALLERSEDGHFILRRP